MRIFVTGTGRCGSVCFKEACKYIRNYSSAHETPASTLDYPDHHIEVNPQLRKCLWYLIEKYPSALFIHLQRERAECVESLAALNHGAVCDWYRRLYPTIVNTHDSFRIAECLYDWETALIDSQLEKAEKREKFWLHEWREWWPLFWTGIGAEGNFISALESWTVPKNTRRQRQET